MAPSTAHLDRAQPYTGHDKDAFGNGNTLSVSHIGTKNISNVSLNDILVVPHLSKKLLSVSKLTDDYPIDILFSRQFFNIQDRLTGNILAKGRREDGLYILSPSFQAHVAIAPSLRASFELWHNRLGHTNYDTISFLNKDGCLSVTSILPKPGVCSSCQISKQHRLSFDINEKRALHILDLVHCDLWGPAPIPSIDGYLYYVIFIDDHSRFTWFYPLKFKHEFSQVLKTFLAFVQNQFSTKLKKISK